jgi:hypothetical protein
MCVDVGVEPSTLEPASLIASRAGPRLAFCESVPFANSGSGLTFSASRFAFFCALLLSGAPSAALSAMMIGGLVLTGKWGPTKERDSHVHVIYIE